MGQVEGSCECGDGPSGNMRRITLLAEDLLALKEESALCSYLVPVFIQCVRKVAVHL
jgi:hypothetical protein